MSDTLYEFTNLVTGKLEIISVEPKNERFWVSTTRGGYWLSLKSINASLPLVIKWAKEKDLQDSPFKEVVFTYFSSGAWGSPD